MRYQALALLLLLLPLVGCAGGSSRTSGVLPTVVLDSGTPRVTQSTARGGVTASGVVVPAREAHMAFLVSAQVRAVHVSVGDQVAVGQVLIELDDQTLQAQLAQARAGVASAQANYDLLAAGATSDQVRQAQATLEGAKATLAGMKAGGRAERVTVADANLQIAKSRLTALEAGGRPEQIAQAQANLKAVQAGLDLLKRGPSDLDLRLAHLAVEKTKDALWAAQTNRDAVCGSSALSGSQCQPAEAQVAIAETGVRQAETQLALLQAGAGSEAIAQAEASVQVGALQLKLVRQPASEQDLVQARQAVRLTEAQRVLAEKPYSFFDLAVAQVPVKQAQAQLDALQAGPTAQQLAAAQAQIAAAQAQVHLAEAQLARASLVAPFAGIVSQVLVSVGDGVLPGQQVLALADGSQLRVQTTDLSERDVPQVQVGQAATVLLEALGEQVNGRVRSISPRADTLGGDVVYQTTIDLDTAPEELRVGMSVQVQFEGSR